jgi:broad specificity phosphatase PhoE
VSRPLLTEKTVVFLRHGQTTWNLENRIQVLP